jgi:hypothetical protein
LAGNDFERAIAFARAPGFPGFAGAPAVPRRSPAGQLGGPEIGVVNDSPPVVVGCRWRHTGPPAGWAHLLDGFPPLDGLLTVPSFEATLADKPAGVAPDSVTVGIFFFSPSS